MLLIGELISWSSLFFLSTPEFSFEFGLSSSFSVGFYSYFIEETSFSSSYINNCFSIWFVLDLTISGLSSSGFSSFIALSTVSKASYWLLLKADVSFVLPFFKGGYPLLTDIWSLLVIILLLSFDDYFNCRF